MSNLELIIKYTKRIESILEKNLGAEGRGLYEKMTSVESKIANDRITFLIRKVATIRNKSVHEEGYAFQNIQEFESNSKEVIDHLNNLIKYPSSIQTETLKNKQSYQKSLPYRSILESTVVVLSTMMGILLSLNSGLMGIAIGTFIGLIVGLILKQVIAIFITEFESILLIIKENMTLITISIVLSLLMILLAIWKWPYLPDADMVNQETKETSSSTTHSAPVENPVNNVDSVLQKPETPTAIDLMAAATKQASLQAEIDRALEAQARSPSQKWISASTREYKYASYMEAWRAKVERIGNINYPDQARVDQLSGSLILDVALNPDGTINEINIKKSSGHQVLDDAAIHIVRLASPFAVFPDNIRKDVDILHITRSWKFLKNSTFSGK